MVFFLEAKAMITQKLLLLLRQISHEKTGVQVNRTHEKPNVRTPGNYLYDYPVKIL